MPLPDIDVVKSIAFPFRLGATSFPEGAEGPGVVFANMVALIMTGKSERVMHIDVGTNVHQFIFDNIDPLTRARIAADVTAAISNWVPEAQIISVNPVLEEDKKNSKGTTIKIDIIYRVAGQIYNQQVPVTIPTSSGP